METLRILFAGLAIAVCAELMAANATVNVSDYAFVDGNTATATTNINQGDTVTWHFTDNTGHSTTSGTCAGGGGGAYGDGPSCASDGIWDSGIVYAQGVNYPRVFSTAGTFHYYCQIHGAMGMVGTVVVAAASGCPTIGLAPGRCPAASKTSLTATQSPLPGGPHRTLSPSRPARFRRTSISTPPPELCREAPRQRAPLRSRSPRPTLTSAPELWAIP